MIGNGWKVLQKNKFRARANAAGADRTVLLGALQWVAGQPGLDKTNCLPPSPAPPHNAYSLP